MQTIGFFGIDKYDIITYLARIMRQLGDRVLLIDFAESGAITKGLPDYLFAPEPTKEDEIVKSDPIEYKGVQYLDFGGFPSYAACDLVREAASEQEYDYILLDMGFNSGTAMMPRCDSLVFVTDQQLHNIKDIWMHGEIINQQVYLLFRDIFDCKIKLPEILKRIGIPFPKDNIYEVPHDDFDSKYKVLSLYEDSLHFTKLSKPLQFFLEDLVAKLHPGYLIADIRKACRRTT